MKKEDAIEILKVKRECFDYEGLSCEFDHNKYDEDSRSACQICEEAVNMAIEALKNEINCVKCQHYTERETDTGIKGVCKMDTAHRGDTISRQDVVNEIHKYFFEEIDKTPTEIDEDGDEVYTDMPTVNSLLACNKELSKRIKSLPSAEVVLQTPQTYGKSINPNTEIIDEKGESEIGKEAVTQRGW